FYCNQNPTAPKKCILRLVIARQGGLMKMMKFLLLSLLLSISSLSALAPVLAEDNTPLTGFQRIVIPEAKCGDGSDYVVWLQNLEQNTLSIEFMGGGACWSQQTCFGTSQ